MHRHLSFLFGNFISAARMMAALRRRNKTENMNRHIIQTP